MEDAAAGGHPLHVARSHAAAIPEAVAMLDRARQNVRNGLDAAMRVPGEPGQVVVRVVVSEIIEQQEGIEFSGVPEPERTAELDARALTGGSGVNGALDGSDRHG